VEMGGNFIDTADVYADSEEVVGRWLKTQRRESLVIATKCCGRMGPGPNDIGLSRKHILSACDASLKRLGTPYIDLYQLHTWDVECDLEEVMCALNDLVRAGKVLYVGVSNFSAYQIMKALAICKDKGYTPTHEFAGFVSLQAQYSLICRSTEWDLVGLCRDEGLSLMAWSPLTGGWLTGKHKRSETEPTMADGSRVAWSQKAGWQATNFTSHDNERTWRILDVLHALAKAKGKTMAQIALRWLMQKPGMAAPIPILGAKTLVQFLDNVGCIQFELTDDEIKKLEAASEMDIPYPWGERWMKTRT